jgi:hypothetical protein
VVEAAQAPAASVVFSGGQALDGGVKQGAVQCFLLERRL